jgi:hypothetical protein
MTAPIRDIHSEAVLFRRVNMVGGRKGEHEVPGQVETRHKKKNQTSDGSERRVITKTDLVVTCKK